MPGLYDLDKLPKDLPPVTNGEFIHAVFQAGALFATLFFLAASMLMAMDIVKDMLAKKKSR